MTTTRAPYAFRSRIFSALILSGRTKTAWYPRTAATKARPTPVLPLVASTIVPPGRIFPSRSAASIIEIPIRSFTEPPGFRVLQFREDPVGDSFRNAAERKHGGATDQIEDRGRSLFRHGHREGGAT